jgi:hypothetical protein
MRAHAVKDYDSVLQVLSEPGCPLCAFLKNFQSKLLQNGQISKSMMLCNARAWALAAVGRSATAAQIFLSLVEGSPRRGGRECSICIRLEQEKTPRSQELLAILVACRDEFVTMADAFVGRPRGLRRPLRPALPASANANELTATGQSRAASC